MTIDELYQEYKRASDRLDWVKQQLLDARRAALPFKVDEVVEAELRYGVWQPAIIRRIDVTPLGWITYYGAVRTKSGWSKQTRYIGNEKNIRKAGG